MASPIRNNRSWQLCIHMTLACTEPSSLGSCLVQEMKMGRSIQESPATLLPCYSTRYRMSPTEEASHGKGHIGCCIKTHTHCQGCWKPPARCMLLVVDISFSTYEGGQEQSVRLKVTFSIWEFIPGQNRLHNVLIFWMSSYTELELSQIISQSTAADVRAD